MDFPEKVQRTIEKYRMIAPGDSIVIGLSGGADSLCLAEVLRLLYGREDDNPVRLFAVHVHHGLRASADRDEAFVAEYVARFGIPLTAVHVHADVYAEQYGCSVEEAGRLLRREAFRREEEALRGRGAVRVRTALAHHLEDSAETLLFNLCRGSRTAGMAGIRPVSGDIIHPLIECSRPEIEQFLKDEGLAWCTDETNESDEYTRNRIRHIILPILEKELNGEAVKHLSEAALDGADAEDFLAQETKEAMQQCCLEELPGKRVAIRIPELNRLHPYIRRRVVYAALVESAGRKKDIGSVHVEALLHLASAGGGGNLSLPYGVQVEKSYDVLTLSKGESGSLSGNVPGNAPDGASCKTAFAAVAGTGNKDGAGDGSPGEYFCPVSESDYSVRVLKRPAGRLFIPSGEYTKWFDYDKIFPSLTFRRRQEGDRMTIGEDGTGKLLSRCFIDWKVPRKVRENIVLPASGKEILWVPGHRVSRAFYVTEETKQILEITCAAGFKSC